MRQDPQPGIVKAPNGMYVYQGVSYPSVTQVIGWFRPPFPAVPAVEIAAYHGRVLHAWIEAIWNGRVTDSAEVPEPIRAQVTRLLAWCAENLESVTLVETPLVHSFYGFGGTPDLVGVLKKTHTRYGGMPVVIDYKSSTELSPYYNLQLLGYTDLVTGALDLDWRDMHQMIAWMPRRNTDAFTMVDIQDLVGWSGAVNAWGGVRSLLRWLKDYRNTSA